MRYLFYMSLIVLSLMIVSCGSGGSGLDSSSPNKTTVMINLGQRSINTGAFSAQAIPPEISYIVIRISAPDMSTIERTISVNGVSTIEVEIPNGLNRHIEIFAYDNSDTLLCYGDTYADFDGTPVTISINMVCVADDTPPICSGLETAQAISETSIALSWTAATDDVTPSSAILYLIYMSMTSGGQDFSAPSFTTVAGATTRTVTGLSSSTTYCFVVRAKDEAGNIDSNTVERCATTFSPLIQEYTLTVSTSGSGSGTVTSRPSGINCGGDCSETYDEGTMVTLKAIPDDIYDFFDGWSGGGCRGTGQCTVTMDADKTVTATFNYVKQ